MSPHTVFYSQIVDDDEACCRNLRVASTSGQRWLARSITKANPIHQSSAFNVIRAIRRDLYRKKTAVYAIARKITVGAMISAFLLSLRCAFWYSYTSADSCESAMALLEDFLEIATIYFINRCMSGEVLENRNIPGPGFLGKNYN